MTEVVDIIIIATVYRASLVAQSVKNLPAGQETRVRSWVGKIPWRREWQSALVVLSGELHGQRSLAFFQVMPFHTTACICLILEAAYSH